MVSLAACLIGAQSVISLPEVRSEADFDRIAGKSSAPYPEKHVRFLIDRREGNRVYFIDSRDDRHHRDFAGRLHLSLDGEQEFFAKNTLRDDRRFLLGWVAYQPPVKKWTFEFWDGDLATADMIRLTERVISKTFFAPVAYKPNSIRQETVSAGLHIPRVLTSEITRNQPYLPLNLGYSIGRLKIVRRPEDVTDADPEDILVLDEAPAGTPPVSGLVFSQPTTPLSHLSLRARGWKIPSSTIHGAQKILANLDGRWVAYRTELGEFHIRLADTVEVDRYRRQRLAKANLLTPKLDLSVTKLASLESQRAGDVVRYGTKSANLGEVVHGTIPQVMVPRGYTIPFSAYDSFVRANGLDKVIRATLADPGFAAGGAKRRLLLAGLREKYMQGGFPVKIADELAVLIRDPLKGHEVFVRSSSNSEDLPNFSGAGLYTTVPNVKGQGALIQAVKTVWASIWNDEAFLARERAGISDAGVAMAVLVQEAVPSESSGVMMTADPFDDSDTDAIFISAKRGIGIRVVDGQRVPEQIVFHQGSNAVQVLTRTEDDERLVFAPGGGVMSVPSPPGRAVLTDELIRKLAHAGQAIQRLFGNHPQDIEWAIVGEQVYILQSRPYLRQQA